LATSTEWLHTGQAGATHRSRRSQPESPKTPNRPTDPQTNPNSKLLQHRTTANTPKRSPKQKPAAVAPVRPVRGTGQTGVTWASRDERHPRVNTSKSKPNLPNRSTDLNKTLGIVGTPHEQSIAKFNPTKTCPNKRNRGNPAKYTSNPRAPKTPKSSPLTHGFGRGITGQRTTKGSQKFPPSYPQEQGLENNPRESQREDSENHHQEQAGTEDHVWFEDRWMVASLCDE
jgi:hypothetical protein